MNTRKVKSHIKKRLEYCNAIAKDIVAHKASGEIISYAKQWAEIESPMTGEIDAAWIRINWSDIYIYVHMDEEKWYEQEIVSFTGEIDYQLDPFSECGGELIDVDNIKEFRVQLENLNLREREIVKNEYNGDFGPDDYPNAIPRENYAPYGGK